MLSKCLNVRGHHGMREATSAELGRASCSACGVAALNGNRNLDEFECSRQESFKMELKKVPPGLDIVYLFVSQEVLQFLEPRVCWSFFFFFFFFLMLMADV